MATAAAATDIMVTSPGFSVNKLLRKPRRNYGVATVSSRQGANLDSAWMKRRPATF
jgi:hypothetical protein